jgi:hypothetical protein
MASTINTDVVRPHDFEGSPSACGSPGGESASRHAACAPGRAGLEQAGPAPSPSARYGLNRRIVALGRGERDLPAAARALARAFNAASASHTMQSEHDPAIVWCVYSNRWYAPGGRYKTTTGEWAYIGHGSGPAYVPPTIKRGRPFDELPADYFDYLAYPEDELPRLFHRGPKTRLEKAGYDDLARYVVENPCSNAALARRLECQIRSVERLKKHGQTLLERLDMAIPLMEELNARLTLTLGLDEASREAEEILARSDDES